MHQIAQMEKKTRHNCVGKVIHWKLSKRLKFDHTIKPEFVRENETYKFLWDFKIQTDDPISALTRPRDKENLQYSGLCHPNGAKSKDQRKQNERQVPGPS